MMKMNFRKTGPLLFLVAAASLTGCASAPKTNAMLDEARAAYRSASANPVVAKSAPIELKKAEKALLQSERLLQDGSGTDAVEHYAYLTRQHAAIAEEKGKQVAAEQAIDAARGERDKTIIMSRTTEADSARARAEIARKQAEEASERARKLQAQVAELEARQTERGLVLTLGDVLFDTGKAKLKGGAMRTIDQLTGFLNQYPQRKLVIEGHTDSVGAADYNQRLSEERADSVRFALLDRGIASTRIMVRGLGEDYPVANNDTAAGRQQNRRVEVIISDDSGKIPERSR